MRRLVAIMLSLVLPVVAVYGLLVPCACTISDPMVEKGASCCARASSEEPLPEPCSGRCDSCNCEIAALPEAHEVNALVPAGGESFGWLSEPGQRIAYVRLRAADRPVLLAGASGPPSRPSLAMLCVRLL